MTKFILIIVAMLSWNSIAETIARSQAATLLPAKPSGVPGAYEFLSPILPHVKRPSNWPEKLEIETLKSTSQKDFLEILSSERWQIVFTCGGRPADARRLADAEFEDGFYRVSLQSEVDKNFLVFHRIPAQENRGSFSPNQTVTSWRSRLYRIENLGDARFKTITDAAYPLIFQLAHIKGSGEFVIINSSFRTGKSQEICGDDSLMSVRVKIPTS